MRRTRVSKIDKFALPADEAEAIEQELGDALDAWSLSLKAAQVPGWVKSPRKSHLKEKEMRKLVWQMMMSLDGLMEGPNKWELDWHVVGEDFARYVAEMEKSIDAMVFGRVTYEGMAEYWPTSPDPEARMMNELPKYVFSRTLDKVDWQNSTLVKGDIEEEIAKLKRQPGKDIAMFGSSDLASILMQQGLIDEYRIMVNPIVLGSGGPMFKGIKERIALKLLKTETFDSGVVVLYYQPA